jgi:hypothetical protein
MLGGAPLAAPHTLGGWTGNWKGRITGARLDLLCTLRVTNDNPITGHIDVGTASQGCSADWSEAQRISDTNRLVNATITTGKDRCVDNQWNVTLQGDLITGTDPTDSSRLLHLRRLG